MPTNDRHVEWVTAISSSLDVEPVTPDDLAPLSGDRAAAARQEAESAERAAAERHTEVEQELDQLTRRRSELLAALDHAERARAELRDELDTHAQEAAQLHERLAEIDAEAAASEQELDEGQVASDALYLLRQELSRTLERISVPVPVEDVASLVSDVQGLAGRIEPSTDATTARALRDWAAAVGSGTAPLAPAARELLDELAGIESERAQLGGDVSADPEVTAARAEVLSCQTTLSELEQQERTGVLGERSRRAIEKAYAHRVELESSRPRATRAQLDEAVAAETEALSHVGFDSMLDFRIVMSSTGVATLARKRRQVAEERLGSATAALESALDAAKARRGELDLRRETLLRRASALVGTAVPTDEVESRLATWYETPNALEGARSALAASAEQLQRDISQLRTQADELTAERVRVVARLAESAATVQSAREELDRLDGERGAGTEELATTEARLAQVQRDAERSAMALGVARDELARVADRRYLDADVADRRTALVQVIRSRIEASRSDHGDASIDEPDGAGPARGGPRGVVLDDPLTDLEPEDAVAVLAALSGIEWGVEVHYVTSRRELIARSRRDGPVRVHDARRRVPRSRWLRRSRGLLPVER